jgi:hypothetical protein
MEKIGFYLAFGAFLTGAMEHHLDRRGGNQPGDSNNALVAACFGGVFAMMIACSVVLAGALKVQATLSTLLSLICVLLMALALNTIAGGVDLLPTGGARVLARLEAREETLRRRVFPFSYALAFLGLAYEAFLTFALR